MIFEWEVLLIFNLHLKQIKAYIFQYHLKKMLVYTTNNKLVSYYDENVISKPTQWFLHDTFTMGSNVKNNRQWILQQGM